MKKSISKKAKAGIGIMMAAPFLLPLSVFAQTGNVDILLKQLAVWMGTIGNLLIAAATIVFFWGIVKFIWQDKKDEGKTTMIWGVIALFVMFSIWGIIKFLQVSTFGGSTTIEKPVIP